ncbi:MAG: hypothetical protein KIT72_03730 [Polyangiaceae bacterium]|nr:hypothetical protein [Polyangiaceae bacterium]MCW5789512.1 hypothetical protein [Polyangiaceae bacterium]
MEISGPPRAPVPVANAATPPSTAAASGPEPSERFKEALSALGSEIDRGEKLVKRSLSGAAMSGLGAGDLIALQAGIYRYSESVDLAGKLVDRAGNAVRTTLQSSG